MTCYVFRTQGTARMFPPACLLAVHDACQPRTDLTASRDASSVYRFRRRRCGLPPRRAPRPSGTEMETADQQSPAQHPWPIAPPWSEDRHVRLLENLQIGVVVQGPG